VSEQDSVTVVSVVAVVVQAGEASLSISLSKDASEPR
jgi:hypothetical protein